MASRRDFIAGYMAGSRERISAQSWVDAVVHKPMPICDYGNGYVGAIDWDVSGFGMFQWRLEQDGATVSSGICESPSSAMRECGNAFKDVRVSRRRHASIEWNYGRDGVIWAVEDAGDAGIIQLRIVPDYDMFVWSVYAVDPDLEVDSGYAWTTSEAKSNCENVLLSVIEQFLL